MRTGEGTASVGLLVVILDGMEGTTQSLAAVIEYKTVFRCFPKHACFLASVIPDSFYHLSPHHPSDQQSLLLFHVPLLDRWTH
jgi:hypothetical protein